MGPPLFASAGWATPPIELAGDCARLNRAKAEQDGEQECKRLHPSPYSAKAASGWRPLDALDCRFELAGVGGHGGFVHVEVGVDVLGVVEVFEDVEEAEHGGGLGAFELLVGGRDHGDFGVLGGDFGGL